MVLPVDPVIDELEVEPEGQPKSETPKQEDPDPAKTAHEDNKILQILKDNGMDMDNLTGLQSLFAIMKVLLDPEASQGLFDAIKNTMSGLGEEKPEQPQAKTEEPEAPEQPKASTEEPDTPKAETKEPKEPATTETVVNNENDDPANAEPLATQDDLDNEDLGLGGVNGGAVTYLVDKPADPTVDGLTTADLMDGGFVMSDVFLFNTSPEDFEMVDARVDIALTTDLDAGLDTVNPELQTAGPAGLG